MFSSSIVSVLWSRAWDRKAINLIFLAALTVGLGSWQVVIAEDKEPSLPLKGQTTELTFTTDEGTWISLDVAADGQHIVFELLGDIYQMPIAGGAAERLTDGLGYDSQPRVSPDGQWIAFISDRDGADNLWVSKRDGSDARKLSSQTYSRLVSPAWTPDSQYIVMTQGAGKVEARMHHVHGGSGLTLKSNEDGKAPNGVGFAFSPDGQYLYYTARPSGRNAFPAGQVERFDMESGEIVPITQGEGGGLRPLVSPDGNKLVYLSRYETETSVRVRDLQTGVDKMIALPIQRDAQEIGRLPSRDYYPNYAFTPDSRALIIHTGGKINRLDIETGQMEVVPFTADVKLDIGPDLTKPYKVPDGVVTATIVHDPALSPDGEKIAASVLTKIYVMDNEEGADPKRLTNSEDWEFKPVWSPDGRWIAYVTWSMDEGGHIWKTRSNGRGRPQKLTEDAAFYTDIQFSPDGDRIVAMRGNEYMRHQTFSEFTGLGIPLDLVWVSASGGDTQLIVPANGARTPHFADDPDRIYLYSGKALTSVRFDGTDLKTHLIVEVPRGNRLFGDEAPTAEDVRISPDGKHALAFVGKQIWAMPVPKIGGDTPKVRVRGSSVPTVQLTDTGADFMSWTDGGKTVAWAIGSTIYSRPFESIDFSGKDEDQEGDTTKSETEDDAGTEATGEAAEGSTENVADASERDAAEEKKVKPRLEDDEIVRALAFTVTVPRAVPEGSILIRGGNVIAMTGSSTSDMASVRENQDILVTNNRIVAMGPTGSLSVPDGAEVMDAKGKFILPGFVDTHAHWEFRTGDVLEPQNWSLVANLAYGVTSGLDVQTSYKDYFAYRDMVETGQSLGQRAFMTGPGIFGNNDFKSYDAVHAYLRRYSDHYKTNNIKSYIVGNRKQRQWVVQASKDLGLLPTTEGAGDMRLDITHAIDGMHGNEHTLTIAPMYRDVLELYAKTQTAYTPTLLVQYNGISMVNYFFTRMDVNGDPKLNRFYPRNRINEMTRRRGSWAMDDEFSVDEIASAAADLQRAGGLVGVGGHGELQGLGYHWEMWAFAMGGMTPAEILRAATIDGAKIIGIEQDLGSIEAGKLADILVLDANPLSNIENTNSIRYVMKNGAVYEGDTLTQVWPERKEMAPFWWWDKSRH